MTLRIIKITVLASILFISSSFWGFYGHQRINRLAVFTLPQEMLGFYKANIEYLTASAVNPDKRRYTVVGEAQRHYIDLDHYGDSALYKMPRYWKDAIAKYSEDTLQAYGIVPWYVNTMYYRLRDAMMTRDPQRILSVSADLGHYIGDAHVPLHTTKNYNGQLTGQYGIHGFWESRLPELYSENYDFLVGRASYLENPQLAIWQGVESAHLALDSVLQFEKELSLQFGEQKYSFEMRGNQFIKVYAREFSKAYHEKLSGMVERQMRKAVKLTGDFWYTAWVDAGQPDLKSLVDYTPTEAELKQRKVELELWKQKRIQAREHID